MNYELNLFGNLARLTLHPSRVEAESLTPENLSAFETMIELESNRIRQFLNAVVCSDRSENKVGRYIRQHQQEMVFLADELCEMRKLAARHAKMALQKIYTFFIDRIADLLSFIRKHFGKYYDVDMPLPCMSRVVLVEKSLARLRPLFDLLDKSALDVDLVVPVKRYLIFAVRNKKLSAVQGAYLNEFIRRLQALLSSAGDRQIGNNRFLLLLVFLNFNKLEFYFAVRSWLRRELETETDLNARLAQLNWFHGYLKEYQVYEGMSYRSDRKSLQQLLLGYLQAEMEAVQAEIMLNPVNEQSSDAYVLPTGFSVPQLAYLLQLLVRAKLFRGHPKRPGLMLDFVADHVSTPGSGTSVSRKHLKNEFNGKNRVAALGIKDILIMLLNLVNKDLNSRL